MSLQHYSLYFCYFDDFCFCLANDNEGEQDTEGISSQTTEKKKFVPHTRQELLFKFEALQLADDKDMEDDSDFSFCESDFEDVYGKDID